jgi:hypothetical protein
MKRVRERHGPRARARAAATSSRNTPTARFTALSFCFSDTRMLNSSGCSGTGVQAMRLMVLGFAIGAGGSLITWSFSAFTASRQRFGYGFTAEAMVDGI